MGVSVTTKVELSGNFFVRDPSKTLYRNIGDMLEALAGEMEGIVRGASGTCSSSGWPAGR